MYENYRKLYFILLDVGDKDRFKVIDIIDPDEHLYYDNVDDFISELEKNKGTYGNIIEETFCQVGEEIRDGEKTYFKIIEKEDI